MTKSTNDTVCLQSDGQLIPTQVCYFSFEIELAFISFFSRLSFLKHDRQTGTQLA